MSVTSRTRLSSPDGVVRPAREPERFLRPRWGHVLLGLIFPASALLAWHIAYDFQLVSPTLLPSPWKTLAVLVKFGTTRAILPDFAMTGLRMSVGFGLAVLIGTALGLAMGVWRPFYYATIPVVDWFRSTPVTILYPAFVLVLGIAEASKIGMVFAGCVFVIALNSAYGVLQSNPLRLQMARLYGASRLQAFCWVVFFDALPQTMIGIRVALSYSLIVALLCEMFMGCQYGLGQRVMDAYTTYTIDEMYALIVLVGLCGFALNRAFVGIERRVVPWSIAARR